MDETTQILVDDFAVSAERLADYMTEMAFTEKEEDRTRIYLLILALLLLLRERARVWAREYLPTDYRKARENANRYLTGDIRTWSVDDETSVQAMLREFDQHMEKAMIGIQGAAAQNRRGGLLLGLLPASVLQLWKTGKRIPADKLVALKSRVRARFRQGLVPIVGTSGNTYHYGLDYYVGLVAEQTRHQGRAAAGVNAARTNNVDLVRVSPNPSTIGDYCDAYRGRVFSLSGNHPTFYPISALPGGTCPFHPHCRHYLIPFDGNNNFPPLDPRFAQLAQSGETRPSVFQSLWTGNGSNRP